mgnify:CR=1 FL=1
MVSIVVLLVLMFNKDVVGFCIRHTPIMNRNYFKILSLEVGTIYRHNIELGLPFNVALARSIAGVGDKRIAQSFAKILLKVEQTFWYIREETSRAMRNFTTNKQKWQNF